MSTMIDAIKRWDLAGYHLSVACKNGEPVGICTRLADPCPENDPSMMAVLEYPEQKHLIAQTLIEMGRIA